MSSDKPQTQQQIWHLKVCCKAFVAKIGEVFFPDKENSDRLFGSILKTLWILISNAHHLDGERIMTSCDFTILLIN